MPYISAQYRKYSKFNEKRSAHIQLPIAPTSGRIIDIAPWPSHIDSSGTIHFTENGREEAEVMRNKIVRPDVAIFATGYRQTFPFFDAEDGYHTPRTADMRRIWASSDPTVGFIGFVRPGFGAIPPLSEMQAQLWVVSIISQLSPLRLLPKPLKFESHYRLRRPDDSRIDYGVDHDAYVYQLATDMGSAPSLFQVASFGWKTVITWALGANFNTKFRLVGPWKWDGANAIMQGELWETIYRRSPYGMLFSKPPNFNLDY